MENIGILQGGSKENSRTSRRPSGIPRSQSRLPRPSYTGSRPGSKENAVPATRNIPSTSVLRIDTRTTVTTISSPFGSTADAPANNLKLNTKIPAVIIGKQKDRVLNQDSGTRDGRKCQSTVSRRISRVPRSSTVLGVCTSKVVNKFSDQPPPMGKVIFSKLADTRQTTLPDIETKVVKETPIDGPLREDYPKPYPTITVTECSTESRDSGSSLVKSTTNATGLDLKKSVELKSKRQSSPRATELHPCDRVSNQGKAIVLSRAKSIKGFVSRHVKPRQTKGSDADAYLNTPDALTPGLSSLPTQILHHTPHASELSAIFPTDESNVSTRANVKEIWTMADEMRLVRVGGVIQEEETLSPKKDLHVVPLFRRSRNGSSGDGTPEPSNLLDTPDPSCTPFQTISAAAVAIMKNNDVVGTQVDTYTEGRLANAVPVFFQCDASILVSELPGESRSKVQASSPYKTPKTGAKRAILNRAQSLVNLVSIRSRH